MVGDGINDLAAISAADVSVVLSNSNDIAIDNSDVVILGNIISKVMSAIQISKETYFTIKENLFWAFIYNIICIPLAAIGILSPIISSIAMAGSSITVMLNSLRLKRRKRL